MVSLRHWFFKTQKPTPAQQQAQFQQLFSIKRVRQLPAKMQEKLVAWALHKENLPLLSADQKAHVQTWLQTKPMALPASTLSPPQQAQRQQAVWAALNAPVKAATLQRDHASQAVIVQIGCDYGQWAHACLQANPNTRLILLEPEPERQHALIKRFSDTSTVLILPYVLMPTYGIVPWRYQNGVAAGLNCPWAPTYPIEVPACSWQAFWQDEALSHIDVLSLSMGPLTYDLCEHLLEAGAMAHIKALQFHCDDTIPQAAQRLQALEQRLQQSHQRVSAAADAWLWQHWQQKPLP